MTLIEYLEKGLGHENEDIPYVRYLSDNDCKVIIKALKKATASRPSIEGDGYAPDGTFIWDTWICPDCGTHYEIEYEEYNFCPHCGKHIDRSELEEQLYDD